MNLYLIRRISNQFVQDSFAYAVVAAETGKAARHIHPTRGVIWQDTMWIKGGKDYGFDIWTNPKNVRSKLLGIATKGTLQGMVCTSFN
jgi:hypothetical protein